MSDKKKLLIPLAVLFGIALFFAVIGLTNNYLRKDSFAKFLKEYQVNGKESKLEWDQVRKGLAP